MRAIETRLRRLEERFRPEPETEFKRNLMARLNLGRQRAGLVQRSPEDLSGMTVEQILHRGRLRASERVLAEHTKDTGYR